MSESALQSIDLLGLPLHPAANAETIHALLGKKGKARLVTFIKPDSWALAERHPDYPKTLQRMTLALADRPEIAWTCRWLVGVPCSRVSFINESLPHSLFKAALAEGKSLILAGGEPGVDEGMQEKLQAHYHGLKILTTYHGYGDIAPKIKTIVSKAPDIVLVDMEAPRGEAFLIALADAGYHGMAITCEGYFAHHLAQEDYYPAWVQRQNLHSLWRILKTPPRSWKRHLGDYRFFVVRTVKALAEKFRARIPSRR